MKIGLYNLEPNIVNTAMMQTSTYHKNRGDSVEVYNPLRREEYDTVYCFSIFQFTDKGYVRNEMIRGGTGFDTSSKLPPDIENCEYDWSLFPRCDYSIVWFSRGCIRDCPFCVVPAKEGMIHSVNPKNLNPRGKYVRVTDNNFFANPKWRDAVNQIVEWNQPVDFQCGIDVRIFNNEQGEALRRVRLHGQLHIAWDNPGDNVLHKIELLKSYIPPYKIMCYVLIGFNTTRSEDLYRVERLRESKIDPFVMPYNKKDKYQKDFARYVNHKAIFKSVKWEDYKGGIYAKEGFEHPEVTPCQKIE